MLKIKDEVKLEELEKFGFKYNDKKGKYERNERCIGGLTYIDICIWNKNIEFVQQYKGDNSINIIYDLIQADLVEKVGD